MGTPEFAVHVLTSIKEAGHEIIGVYTQPDKPKGRGKSLQYPPVKEKALEYGIPVYQPPKVREPEVIEEIRALQPEVIVVVAFGQILPEAILNIPRLGCVNVHASLLPKYRGAAPIQQVIIDGEKESGVTTMYMAKGLDTGDMIERVVVPIDEKETGGSYHDKLAAAGAKLILSTLEKLKQGTAPRIPQDDSLSCYAHMLDKQMAVIDWSKSAHEIDCLIRGLNPWPIALTSLAGERLKVFAAEKAAGNGEPGTVLEADPKKGLTVACGEGALRLTEIQLVGGKRMKATDFLRGHAIEVGTKLGD